MMLPEGTSKPLNNLAAGANINAKDINQWTPLHHAALHGQKESIEILIAEDADVNVWARINTPLHLCSSIW